MGEPQVPEALQHLGMSYDELVAAQNLVSIINPHIPPTLLFTIHQLHLSCENPSRKKLSPGDVNPLIAHRNALLVPRGLVMRNISPFLNANENPRNGIPIRVYDTYRGQYRLSFLRGNDEKYLITHGPAEEDQRWSDVVEGAGLQEGDFIKLWTLRHNETDQLCFVIGREAQVFEAN